MNYKRKYEKYKTKYLELQQKNQSGGSIVQQPSDNGAGVIIIENYLDHKRKAIQSKPAFILFRNIRNGMYSDGGGNREKGEDLRVTATRELKEESANLFRLSPNTVLDTHAIRHVKYVGYFVQLKSPIFSAEYFKNLGKLQGNKTPKEWLETDNFKRVYFDDFINAGGLSNPGDLQNVRTTDGAYITIFGRTKALLREFLNSKFKDNLQVIKPEVNEYFQTPSNQFFLNGTYAYFTR